MTTVATKPDNLCGTPFVLTDDQLLQMSPAERRALARRLARLPGTGVTPADDDHVLARRQNLAVDVVARNYPVLLRQELHREVDSLQLPTRNRQIARLFRSACKQDHVEVVLKLRNRNVHADVSIRNKLHTFSFHLLDASVDQMLLHLEIRDPVAEQASDPVPLLKKRHIVTSARQLLRSRESSRP